MDYCLIQFDNYSHLFEVNSHIWCIDTLVVKHLKQKAPEMNKFCATKICFSDYLSVMLHDTVQK